MSSSSYLDLLDDVLRNGLNGLSDVFVDSQIKFVADCQQTDGGFPGRQGRSDLYYTDFAVRCLALLAPGHEALPRAAKYIERLTGATGTIVECFSLLNLRRIFARCLSTNDIPNEYVLKELLQKHHLPQGGFARYPGSQQAVSAYQTFLAALCFQMLGHDLPDVGTAIQAMEKLKRPDGGYAELDGQADSQTSATAAAIAFLMMHDAVQPEDTADTIQYFAAMQASDGGLKPHATIDQSDLLSTFTGLLSLAGLDALSSVNLAAAAKFIRHTAHPNGGFLACPNDGTPDVEYTYYGLGSLALLRASQ